MALKSHRWALVCFVVRPCRYALGHQGVGIIEKIGPNVKELKKGDRVGWGYQHACCGYCDPCRTGRETYCPQRELYDEASLDQGSFAPHAVWHEAFVFPLPNALADEEVTPLMCAGATVFNVLYTYGVKSADCVGVVGMGVLGHLAIQYAAKMGCKVVVFSSLGDKRSEFITMGVKFAVSVRRPVDALLVTTLVLLE